MPYSLVGFHDMKHKNKKSYMIAGSTKRNLAKRLDKGCKFGVIVIDLT